MSNHPTINPPDVQCRIDEHRDVIGVRVRSQSLSVTLAEARALVEQLTNLLIVFGSESDR
jgi:hypothetical protein